MAHNVEIVWAWEPDTGAMPGDEMIKSWADEVLSQSGSGAAAIAVKIVSGQEMTELNSEYRGLNTTTNVLSFPLDVPVEGGRQLLGDIAICAPVVIAEAAVQGKTNHAHFAHMLVHGILHLRGHDHVNDDQAEVMEKLEIEILDTMGFSNPYKDQLRSETQGSKNERC
jgi:probable rRNA maturation factor